MNSITVLSLVFACASSIDALPLSNIFTPCHKFDPDSCFFKQAENAFPKLVKGIPEYGLEPIDPMHTGDFKIDSNGLKVQFTDSRWSGLSNAKLNNFTVDWAKNTFTIDVAGSVVLFSKYNANGKLLLLPISGKGDSKIKIKNANIIITVTFETYLDGSIKRYRAIKPNFKYTFGKVTLHFDNLFNGNKELSESTHQIVNSNWKIVADEFGGPIAKNLVHTLVANINNFFKCIPASEVLLE